MDSARLDRIQTLFHDAVDLPETERQAFLEAACGDDKDLLAHVLALLEEDARGGSLLDRDLAQVADRVLEGPDWRPPVDAFGPYRIKRVLGEGGMGVVYLAERPDLERLVAVKILRDAWLSPARREQFAGEQRTLAQLTHPLIARLYDADTLPDGTPYFVMEYIEGVPLTDYARQQELPMRRRLELFRSVCEAVAYAHQHAIIHRDLKPSNILVKADGTVCLLDFGISKQLDSVSAASNPTLTGLRFMTPAYAAPEQIRGERLGVQTDVYSLGVVLYELLTGNLPFDLANRTPGQAERIILEQEPEKPSVQGRHRSAGTAASWADLDVLCLTAMHKDIERRYRSVEALMRDVDHYLRDEPLEAHADALGYRVGKFLRRNRRAVLASAAVVIAVLGLTTFFVIRLAAARNAALAETARTERVRAFMTRLFQGGDQSVGPADDLRVVTLLDRGIKEAAALGREPDIQADLYYTLGTLYESLGNFDKADLLLNSALKERRSLPGDYDAQIAETLTELSLMRAHQARFDEAEKLARDAVDLSARRLAPVHPAVGRAKYALGTVMVDRGAYSQAIPVLEQAIALQSGPGAPKLELSDSLTELANAQFYLGRYQESYALNTRVLDVDRQLYGARHPNVAEDLLNLGAMQLQWGHYSEAERFDREALDLIQSWFGKEHPETASALTAVGRALVAANRVGEARGLLRQALAIQEKAYGPNHPRVASALGELGKVALQQGDLDEAEADFRRTADIYRAVYGQNHFLIATALSNLGSVYLQRKQYPRAEEFLREAVRRNIGALGPNHANTAVTRIKLGRVLARQQRWAEAEAESAAGYGVLVKQVGGAQANWLKAAREDLADEYAELHDGVKAAQFRAELAKMTTAANNR